MLGFCTIPRIFFYQSACFSTTTSCHPAENSSHETSHEEIQTETIDSELSLIHTSTHHLAFSLLVSLLFTHFNKKLAQPLFPGTGKKVHLCIEEFCTNPSFSPTKLTMFDSQLHLPQVVQWSVTISKMLT